MLVDKILKKDIVNDNEVFLIFLNKEHTISIARVAKVNNKWRAFVSPVTDRVGNAPITWQCSLVSNPPVENEPEVARVMWGYIYSSEVAKVVVGSDDDETSFREAQMLELNSYNAKLYYFLSNDDKGFNCDTVIAYDAAGNQIFSNRNFD